MGAFALAVAWGAVCYAVIRMPYWRASSTYRVDEPDELVEPHKDDPRWGGTEG